MCLAKGIRGFVLSRIDTPLTMHETTTTTAFDFGSTDFVNLSEAKRHALLASDRRRVLLGVLAEMAAPVDLSDLATAVGRAEQDAADSSLEGISIALHHNHLPKLAEHAIVDYVPETNRVEAIRI